MRILAKTLIVISLFIAFTPFSYAKTSTPIDIKVVVVTMFEIGNDEGDKAGEFQLWKQGQQLNTRYPLPHGHHDIYVNEETGVLGIVTGMGIARAASAIMALGLDPRFNLTKAYWLVAGIAGIDPFDDTVGSAVWTDYVVDGDLAHQIDAREIPTDWETGYFPLFTHSPYANADAVNPHNAPNGEVYILNQPLVDWAFSITKNINLPNTSGMDKLREQYTTYPNALKKPSVTKGAHLSASTFWHGKLLNQWANKWVAYWTKNDGNFVTSGMEDSATLQAISYLHNAKLADKNRVLVLRTASNFTMQPDSLTAAKNLESESSGAGYAGLQSAVEAAYSVGSVVVEYLTTHWQEVENTIPEVKSATSN